MWVIVYIVLSAFITWKIARFYFSLKFRNDVKFIQAVLKGEEFIIQKAKRVSKKYEEVEDTEE